MIFLLIQFAISAAVIILAARWLAKASDAIARLTGLGRIFVGGLFLAGSTSAPELFVDIEAASKGMPNLAAGDLMGSSLVNLCIFCLLFLIFRPRQPSLQDPSALRLGLLAVLMTLEAGLLIFFKPTGNLLGLHWGSYVLILTYLGGIRFVFHKPAVNEPEDFRLEGTRRRRQLGLAVLRFCIAAAVIFFAAPVLVVSAEALGQSTGLSNSFIGTTLVALTTSLPELASSIIAARMGIFDMVLGNIVGSNAFNMLIFVLMDGVWTRGDFWGELSRLHALSAALVVFSFLVLGTAWFLPKDDRFKARRIAVLVSLTVSFSGFAALYFFGESLR